MKKLHISLATAAACLFSTALSADDTKPKRQLKNNMMVVTNVTPKSVDSITDVLSEGIFYGRVRSNAFKWDWKNETAKTKDNHAIGVGGSLRYQTARYQGFSALAGAYVTTSPFSSVNMDDADVGFIKAGKDTLSRNKKSDVKWKYLTLAEANLQYKFSKTQAIVGRQIFESFITKSNDTKMIPNTFEGFVLETKDLPDTRIRGAYFTAQKLRDHTEFHDVITYSDATGNSWAGNDDSATHKGLSYSNFQKAGKTTDHELIVVDLKNTSIKGLQVDVTYASVPGVVSSITGELNYTIGLGGGYSLTPGVRYMQQMDNGGGAVGGAGLKGTNVSWTGNTATYTSNGYNNPDSLNASLAMARLVLKKGPIKAQIAYSQVGDEADIVAPWRGFPTGGYTRAMAQYNWYSNTKTTAAEVNYDFGKAGLVSGFSALARFAMQDFDEAKQLAGNQADSNILHMDFRQNITPDFYAKIRVGLVSAADRIKTGKDQDSYNEYRFELNYLF